MSDKFTIYDISEGYAFEDFEQLGTKAKHWVIDGIGQKFLFKKGRPNTGENWAEIVACELAKKLNLPHANYYLSVENGQEGVLTNSFVPEGGGLRHGNEFLGNISDSAEERRKRSSMRKHIIKNVMSVTDDHASKPIGWNSFKGVRNATDVFCGYLLLDALIANQDRHYENWGYVLTRDKTLHLAPTFDHASSLGRNERDEVMKERLVTKDRGRSIEHYVTKARSSLYFQDGDNKPLSTIDAFLAWGVAVPDAASAWIENLSQLSDDEIISIVDRVPDTLISSLAKEFTSKMLVLNKERLLDTRGNF